jgi:hypothetical protein
MLIHREILYVLFLILSSSSHLFSEPIPTEEIEIYFHCKASVHSDTESVRRFIETRNDKLEKEGGRVYLIPIKEVSPSSESQEFTIQNGRFIWKRTAFSPDSYSTKHVVFTLEFNPEPYTKWKDYQSPSLLFWILDEPIPNSYRFNGNTNFLSCPDSNQKLGKLRLVFRNKQLIRKNLEYVTLENWRGDL